jgi:hypothetical protein
MKKYVLISLVSLFFASCTPEENVQDVKATENNDCMFIFGLEDNPKGDIVELRYTPENYITAVKIKVQDYKNYKLGQVYCDLSKIK